MLEIIRDGKPLVDREWARGKTAEEVIAKFESLVDFDHNAPLKGGGSNAPANIVALTKATHLEKTKLDVPRIAKGKRLSKEHEAFRQRMLAKSSNDLEPLEPLKKKWQSRKMEGKSSWPSRGLAGYKKDPPIG